MLANVPLCGAIGVRFDWFLNLYGVSVWRCSRRGRTSNLANKFSDSKKMFSFFKKYLLNKYNLIYFQKIFSREPKCLCVISKRY